MPKFATLQQRIQEKVSIRPDGCHHWLGAKHGGGYAAITWKGKTRPVTRVLWEETYGPIDSHLFLCHKCDNRACVNLEHLFVGTAQDNARDKLQKGRPNGGGPIRVSAERRDKIKELYAAGMPWQKIQELVGGGTATIHRVLKGTYDNV